MDIKDGKCPNCDYDMMVDAKNENGIRWYCIHCKKIYIEWEK